jgi:NifU-like protein involved in Fe-S cluster formation
LKIKDDIVVDWSFMWITSIITTATSSVFGESIIWMDLKEVLTKDYDYIVELIWEEVSPRRQKAAVFWLVATRNAIHIYLKDGKKDDILDMIMWSDAC